MERDTIVLLEVDKQYLFRPAYTTDVDSDVTYQSPANQHINSLPQSIRVWFALQQIGNFFPWTRMGYTYDWGDPHNHIGTSEFILKPNSPIQKVSMTTIDAYLP